MNYNGDEISASEWAEAEKEPAKPVIDFDRSFPPQSSEIDDMGELECPFCKGGNFKLQKITYHCETPDAIYLIAGLYVDKCSWCGDIVFPSASSDYIDRYITFMEAKEAFAK
jgi:hypothetical protein